MILNIHEIFEDAANIEDKEKKISFLRKNNSKALAVVLYYMFHKEIDFFTTEIPPSYKPNDSPPGMGYSKLHSDWKQLRYFIKDHQDTKGLTLPKKKQMLLQFLEALEAKEAEVIIHMMKHDNEYYGLRKTIVKEAFPDLGL